MPRLAPTHFKRAISMLGLKHRHSTEFREQELFECPFHSDTNPSFSVNFRRGVFNCFQCGRHGSIGSLVWERKHVSIRKFLGIERDEDTIMGYAPKTEEAPEEETVKEEPVVSALDVRGVPVPFGSSPEALLYLKKRDITLDVAKGLEVQYSDEITLNGTTFFKRLLIPIYDPNGVLVNMEGRDVTFRQKPKCLYPKNAVKPLFQFDRLDLTKPVFVFEGIIKMAVARADPYFANSTSTLGMRISEYQVGFIKQIPHIIIIPDNDDAGRKIIPAIRGVATGKVEVLSITNYLIKDADEIPKKSGMSVREFRENNGFQEEINYDLGGYY